MNLPTDGLIKVLDDEPFTVVAEHWVSGKRGMRPYLCPERNCPLCDAGHQPQIYGFFTILDLSVPRQPSVIPWKCSIWTLDKLEQLKAIGPLSAPETFFMLSTIGGGRGRRVEVIVDRVTRDDLDPKWLVPRISERRLGGFQRLTEDDVLRWSTEATLRGVAARVRATANSSRALAVPQRP